jgi:hypothetical protein
MKPTYTKLAADGSDLPADSTEKHLAVRVDHPLLAKPIILAAYRCAGKPVAFKKAQEVAAAHDAYGWQWRTGSPEELFLVTDRTDPSSSLPKEFFPDAEDYEWTWSNLVDASSPSGYAWFVALGYGGAYWGGQSGRYSVRAVCAGQS